MMPWPFHDYKWTNYVMAQELDGKMIACHASFYPGTVPEELILHFKGIDSYNSIVEELKKTNG